MTESNLPACGCDCGFFASDPPSEWWSNCECRLCGTNQACTVPCSEIRRYFTAIQRGKAHEFNQACVPFRSPADFTEEFKANHPKFCGSCIDHGILQLNVEGVPRPIKRREEFADDNKSAKQRAFPGAPSS